MVKRLQKNQIHSNPNKCNPLHQQSIYVIKKNPKFLTVCSWTTADSCPNKIKVHDEFRRDTPSRFTNQD